ncbi:hypothetical protein C8R43DRAFT_960164 [Mycena crocata]|nr:hypothetical protein C8R43DRAFT_960164 [Mycena crocata]
MSTNDRISICLSATTTLFRNPLDWERECAKFPNPAANFFCNPLAYSKRKSKRSPALVAEYWKALSLVDCPDWESNTTNDGGYRFNDCYNFLKKENPSRFREIGSLAAFLLASDFSYAGVVQPPTVAEVGNIIRGINKGGASGLEMLGLLKPRERGAKGTWRLANVEEVKAGFGKLYTFLDKKLTAAQKGHMIFDGIMTENSLCKLTKVVKEKQFFISM